MPPRRVTRARSSNPVSDDQRAASEPAAEPVVEPAAEPRGEGFTPAMRQEMQAMIAAAIQAAMGAQAHPAEPSLHQPRSHAPSTRPSAPVSESVAGDKPSDSDPSTDDDEYAMDPRTKQVSKLTREAIRSQAKQFHGTEPHAEAKRWIMHIQEIVEDLRYNDKSKLKVATKFLQDEAAEWWRGVKDLTPKKDITWNFFVSAFHEQYYPQHAHDEAYFQFEQLKQGHLTPEEYYREFMRLARLFPEVYRNKHGLSRKFLRGLNPELQRIITDNGRATCEELLRSAVDKSRVMGSGRYEMKGPT